ncbi:MAG: hypothetical protein WBM98_07085 [Maribacter sp.]|uniref:hypothetical protein n=1 Tax=Maribacter sp. TaxID=1897614 RepID=UPI003C71D821
MKNLEKFEVRELSAQEITEIEGGFWNYVVSAIAYVAYEWAANPTAHNNAVAEGYNSYKSNLQ